ncbi:ferredoxin--NADP+ reductase [Streptomyces griseochromogenes]|uniref:ferredoxin--NADP(+) reductase n=1 Tax=Streptomyces griseochromogenes TaxID=68214 RepID=A0A1B1B331_9ACTN|nr:FAD-dependent oxidoreductase [Streptomyces griseochromogenes]ANP53226.1 NADP oxidoreductase [Streptomyces griseochromogenes]MBP2053930.1 ferredoxin--NADP+ reductase [Streptomyces griseochromogenes]
MLRVAVVGSGPSGCYTAQTLVQQDPEVRVDVLDRLPCPYGLVRYGVAPDHEKIKSLQGSLRTVLEHDRVRFLGGVRVGGPGGLPVPRLRELYHAVVYCVGAATDRHLGIPGEELPGSWSATEFVSWYSAHPDAADAGYVRGVRSAVVIGVGNVAVDVTRMLVRGAGELRPTDMPQAALDTLAASGVAEVHMVGRRGPSQARFTTKELRELGGLPDTEVTVDPGELALDPGYTDSSALPAVQRRNVEALRRWAAEPPRRAARRIRLRFFLRPVELLADGGRVAAVRFERTVPDGRGGVTGTGRYEDVPAQLVLRSVGYRGVPLEGLPFDTASGTVPHREGRVLREGVASPGEYVAGWIKRGPTGVIGTNRPCAKETATSLLADAPGLVRRQVPEDPLAALRAAGVEPVPWSGWLAIEHAEAELGARLGRSVVKLADWDALLGAARSA